MKQIVTKATSSWRQIVSWLAIVCGIVLFAANSNAADYTYYFDLSNAVSENGDWSNKAYAYYYGYGNASNQETFQPMTKVEGNIWKIEITGATSIGSIILKCTDGDFKDEGDKKGMRSYPVNNPVSGHKYTVSFSGTNWWFNLNDAGVYEPAKVKYYTNANGAGWTSSLGEIGVGDSFTINSKDASTESFFVFGKDNLLGSWDNIFGATSNTQVYDNGTGEAKYRGNNGDYKAPFLVKDGTYTITITEISKDNYVKFSVKKTSSNPGSGDSTVGSVYFVSSLDGWKDGKLRKANDSFTFNCNGETFFIFSKGSTMEGKWDDGTHYGADSGDQLIGSGTYDATYGSKNCYKLSAGSYTIKINSINSSKVNFTVTKKPMDYVFYVDVSEIKSDKPLYGTNTFMYYTPGDVRINMTAVDDAKNIWKGEIKNYSGNLEGIYFSCYDNLSGKSEEFMKSDTFKNPINGHVYKLYVNGKNWWLGVKDAGSLDNLINEDRAGKYYLLGSLLNDEYESPAWELIYNSKTGLYEIDQFAYRPCVLKVAYYDNNGVRSVITVEESGTAKSISYGIDRKPGWACTATFNPNGKKLVVNKVAGHSVLPYIGVLGKNFRQPTNHETRNSYYKNGEERMGHTNDGWQEAYIEYDEFGEPVLDSEGVAYYNTVWPPRNNILMKSHIGDDVDDLNVTSDDLTMIRDSRGVMTGKEWTTLLKREYPGDYEDENYYKNSSLGFKLDEDVSYARYYVENVWMMGEYKLWTGWAGNQYEFGANWSQHRYLGPGGQDDNAADNKQKKINETYFIFGEQNNFHTAKKGDNSYAREYYRTMELFLPIYNDNEDDYFYMHEKNKDEQSRFYITETKGGAQVDAVARKNQYVGYIPSLANVPSGYHVQSYTVTRYQYEANKAKDKLSPVTKDGKLTSKENAKVVSGGSSSINSETAFNNQFSKDSQIFSNLYVNDGEYAVGRYIFRLEVKFSNGVETLNADVWSPWVEILEADGNVKMNNYQLIEVPKGNDYTDYADYKYVTYSENYNAVFVKVDGTGKVTELNLVNENEDLIKNIYENDGVWTNKTLLLVSEPTNYTKKTSFNVVTGSTTVKNLMSGVSKIGSYYPVIYDNSTKLSTTTFKANFEGSISTEGGSAEVTGSGTTVYVPHFMLPAFSSASLYFDKEGSATGNSHEGTYDGSHDDIDNPDNNGDKTQQSGIQTNRHMLRADIEVKMPNVSQDIKAEVYKDLNLILRRSNGNTYALTVKDSNAPKFGLEYKYQNPHDWMTYEKDKWVGTPHSWILDTRSYNTAVGVIPVLNNNTEVTLAPEPQFTAPDVKAVSNAFIWTMKDNVVEIYANNLQVNNNTSDDYLFSGNNQHKFVQNDKSVFMVKVTSNKGAETVSKIFDYTNGKLADNENPIVTFKPTDINYDGKGGSKETAEMLKDLKVEVGYAYLFSAGGTAGSDSNDENKNAAITSSGYLGFDSENGFPTIREDHEGYDNGNASGQSSVRRRVAAEGDYDYNTDDPTTSLLPGDNAFILVPEYAVVKDETTPLESIGMPTDVENVDIDGLGTIRTGRGFIEVTGDNVEIYSASGMHIATGAGRYDVPAGIYMVSLSGQVRKVLVK